jgi:hypothetical protein
MDDLQQRAVDRFLDRTVRGQRNRIVVHRQYVRQNLQIAPTVLLDQVAEDRSFVDESLYIAALQLCVAQALPVAAGVRVKGLNESD